MLPLLLHAVAFVLLGAVVWLLVHTSNRADRARIDDMGRLARRHGWTLPGSIDWTKMRFQAPLGSAQVDLSFERHRVAALAPFTGELAQIQRRAKNRSPGAYPGLLPALTGDDAFDQSCDLHTTSGKAPTWLGAEVRAAIALVSEPVTVAAEKGTLTVELRQGVRSPFLFERLVEIAAAIVDPNVGRARAVELERPVPTARTASAWFLRLALVALLVTLALAAILVHVPPVQSLLSQGLCEEGEELAWSWLRRRGGEELSFRCGRTGAGSDGLVAWLLCFEALALPALAGSLFVALERGLRYPAPRG